MDRLTVPLEKDLSAFSRFLSAQGIEHRIVEHGGRQLLYSPHDSAMIRQWFEQWCAGHLDIPPPRQSGIAYQPAFKAMARYPVVLALVVLSALLYFITQNNNAWVSYLSFQDIRIERHGVLSIAASLDTMLNGQWWRLLTPIFLHFGLLHLLFNGLWLIEFGRRIEGLQSHSRLIIVVVVTGVISNFCQYIYEPSILFGGLSGVVYGLFAYCWLMGYWESRSVSSVSNSLRGIAPLPGVAPFLLFWLLLCMSGVLRVVDIHVANAAHVGGLLSGLLMALLYRILSKRVA